MGLAFLLLYVFKVTTFGFNAFLPYAAGAMLAADSSAFAKALEALQDKQEFLFGGVALLAVALGVVSPRKKEEVL